MNGTRCVFSQPCRIQCECSLKHFLYALNFKTLDSLYKRLESFLGFFFNVMTVSAGLPFFSVQWLILISSLFTPMNNWTFH